MRKTQSDKKKRYIILIIQDYLKFNINMIFFQDPSKFATTVSVAAPVVSSTETPAAEKKEEKKEESESEDEDMGFGLFD